MVHGRFTTGSRTVVFRVVEPYMEHLALKDKFTPPIRMTEHCGHNFCHACISSFIAGQLFWNCPECRSQQTKKPDDLVRNRLVEKAVKQFNASPGPSQSKALCPYHGLELSICMSNLLS